uniref:Orofacial cleft 1 candidate gene 1 protein n=2 Tax=Cyprinus carpio TaxID=7962 RepID=A0A9J8AKE4_CYPCA
MAERVLMEGAVNPAFQEDSEEESEMRSGGHDSTLAAQKCVGLQATATTREFMNEDERNLYDKLSEMFQEEDASTVIDLPGMVTSEHAEYVEPAAENGWRDRRRAELLERRAEVIPPYVEQLKECVQRDMIPVSRLTLEQEERSERGKTEEKVWARKKRVMSLLRGNSKIRRIDEEEAILQDRLYAVFQRAENRLLNSLRQRQAEVVNQYGEIIEETENTEHLGIESDLHWQVEWIRTPEPIETQLGGRTLRWSRLQEQQWVGRTEPVEHQGRYFDIELNINQSLYMVLPASCDLLPSSALVFKLLSLPGDHSHVSSVVGWGAFPICDCSFQLFNGKFKTPLLRGSPNPSLNQFRRIEHLLSTDLDNWLCNLYFQVKRLPRGSTGVPERSFTLQIPSHPQLSSSQGLHPHPDTSIHSSASLPGKSPSGAVSASEPSNQTNRHIAEKSKAEIHSKSGRQKKIIERNSEALKPLPKDQLDQFTFSVRSQHHNQHRSAAVCCGTGERTRLAVRLLPSLLGLSCRPRPHLSQISLTILLFSLMWFPRLYLHYCSQWLFLQAQHIPINRFGLSAHTVDLVYQGSLLSTLEEVLLVLLGPLTLNAATLLLLLIRWGCQLTFGSPPSFLSKFIMAAAVWTFLDPLAVFAVDAVLGRLSYSAEEPLADAAKLYWHFFRTEQSGTAGIIITLFLYGVHSILSFTFIYVYFLRLHNDGRLLDIYQRLHSTEGAFFVPHDMEVSNQELNYIVKKAEQWRGFNGERRKVAVYDYIWMEEEPVVGLVPPSGTPNTGCETSTHLSIYTLHLSGLRQHYRHFLRQPDGAIIEVMHDSDSKEFRRSEAHEEHGRMKNVMHLRERKRRKPAWRSHRVEPLGGSACDSSNGIKEPTP